LAGGLTFNSCRSSLCRIGDNEVREGTDSSHEFYGEPEVIVGRIILRYYLSRDETLAYAIVAIAAGTVKTTWKYSVSSSSASRCSIHVARARDWHVGQCRFRHELYQTRVCGQ